ncbi:hypothetical protein LAZ40_23140 [Cereibacter sphaeroides]|uniref:hypothetical protein n=1 Tax=Rhodobacterales TaxID=204455 RepID=UPI000BBF14A8|nr:MULTISPECIES: hypothetical protein [Paracoccaceae]MCE6961937.1 hypothetical protein [Cereibacter sphaeroides]MCE6970712.1 hypothetical protein [Cereibacter sphaeroides]MCE6975692.1 hypothetical protein [Cereibacter sphaeroides]
MRLNLPQVLAPLAERLPVPARPAREDRPADAFDLVRTETHLRNRAQVERYLPDILGRALARIWIDPLFRDEFAADPVSLLARHGVFLPETISIVFETEGSARPRVVVYEQKGPLRPRQRMLYLQLVMMAGK